MPTRLCDPQGGNSGSSVTEFPPCSSETVCSAEETHTPTRLDPKQFVQEGEAIEAQAMISNTPELGSPPLHSPAGQTLWTLISSSGKWA